MKINPTCGRNGCNKSYYCKICKKLDDGSGNY